MVPKLRFKEVSINKWETFSLGEIANFRRGSFPQPYGLPEWFDDNGYPFVQVFDVSDNMRLKDRTKSKISQLAANQSIFAPKGTLIMTIQGSIGRLALMQYDAYVDRTLLIFQSYKKNINIDFLKYSLFLLFDIEKKKADGGVIRTITKQTLTDFRIGIPSNEEQTKIADFLSSIDEKITLLNKQYDLLCRYKKGMMQKIFSQDLRFKNDSGYEYPEWEEVELKKIASKVNTKNRDNSVSTVLTNSATQGIVSQESYFEREIVTESNLTGYYVVRIGDFVYNPRISSTAPVGPIKMNELTQGVMSPLYTVFRFEKGLLKFYQYFFESSVWHDYMKSVANSGARHDRMNISGADFFGLPVPQPLEEEQTKIARFLSAIDDKITIKKAELDKLKTWKQGLLQQMFI
ncbi:TPA: restriction endonuclease subunit S [Serratia marcescens]|mgnify:FL=1|jgi:type I restriction enzyme S subunit|uniref:restriction endonuclease subunit S n=1 Tax=Escherichia coli TaxID=562 RepID=UPI00180E9A58|nr:restriction endonuclease subunit S [Escherichia coli]HEJ6972539.1 restriction endonuclease subunit S [Serratia marcescens]EFH3961332.1 restriction endonuclease subunit S [Escherichia coli]EFH5177594.1 restriction endonuclease subunit S [Escherichia coli]EFI3627340.1 restriction endonuclease subunit S [Escherichia coli]EHO4011998.1 restriction endonuclease subunit S [Escherichia coli]